MQAPAQLRHGGLARFAADPQRQVVRTRKRPRIAFEVLEELYAQKRIARRRVITERQHEVSGGKLLRHQTAQTGARARRENQIIRRVGTLATFQAPAMARASSPWVRALETHNAVLNDLCACSFG